MLGSLRHRKGNFFKDANLGTLRTCLFRAPHKMPSKTPSLPSSPKFFAFKITTPYPPVQHTLTHLPAPSSFPDLSNTKGLFRGGWGGYLHPRLRGENEYPPLPKSGAKRITGGRDMGPSLGPLLGGGGGGGCQCSVWAIATGHLF